MNQLLSLVVAEHDGSTRTRILTKPAPTGQPVHLSAAGAKWELTLLLSPKPGATDIQTATLTAKVLRGNATQAAFGLLIEETDWSLENYVLIPGAVYAGNRFPSTRYPYPPSPSIRPKASHRDLPYIGDIPRLSFESGKSHLDQMSIDAATPGLGIYFPKRDSGLLLLTPQLTPLGPYGIEIIESDDRTRAQILLMTPGFRHDHEFHISGGFERPSTGRAADLPEGSHVEMRFEIHEFRCHSVQGLFDRLFVHRENCFQNRPARQEIPFSAVWDILHEKHNRQNWNESLGLYQVGLPWRTPPNPFQFWQTGWCGGGIPILPMIQQGDATSLDRACRNLDFIFTKAQAPSGFLKNATVDGETWVGEAVEDGDSAWVLVRRNADALYFILRAILLLNEKSLPVSTLWKKGLQRALTAWNQVWKNNRDLGQYVDWNTGEITISGSTSGALFPALFALASKEFSEPEWMTTAIEIAEFYRSRDLARGITTGAPGDCVQAPESESIAALIESFITLYEFTGDPQWKNAARDAVIQKASWTISYDYQFPPTSALGELGLPSKGAVLANAQNKCGVPGICTLSGQGILRTARATDDLHLLELLKDIAHLLPEYLSREDRPIPARITWAWPYSHLPHGWICERVNITQWGEPLGEQAAYSCWCEVAMMLTWNDLPGVYAQPDTGRIICLDHVNAEWSDDTRTALRITNPTKFPARVRLMIETSREAKERVLPIHFAATLPQLTIAPGESALHVNSK